MPGRAGTFLDRCNGLSRIAVSAIGWPELSLKIVPCPFHNPSSVGTPHCRSFTVLSPFEKHNTINSFINKQNIFAMSDSKIYQASTYAPVNIAVVKVR